MAPFRPRKLLEYLEIIWRRRMWIALCISVVWLPALLVIARVPDVYESRAVVLLASTQEHETPAFCAQVSGVTYQLRSRSNLASIIKRHSLYDKLGDLEDALEVMHDDLVVDIKMRSYSFQLPESFSLRYRYENGPMAKQVLTELIGIFDAANDAAKERTSQEAAVLAEMMDKVKAEVEQIDRQIASSGRSGTTVNAAGVVVPLEARRTAQESKVAALQDKEYALQQQISGQKRRITEQEKLVQAALKAPAARDGALGVLMTRKSELEARLKEYAPLYTDKNPKVIQVRTQLTELEEQIAGLDARGVSEAARASLAETRELRSLEFELSRLQIDLEVLQRQIQREQGDLSLLAAQPSSGEPAATPLPASNPMMPNYEQVQQQQRYTLLLQRQDELESKKLRLSTPLFHVLDPPTLPARPVGPNRSLLTLFTLACALAVALFIVGAVEIWRFLFIQDARDVDYLLGAPVLAMIPATLTLQERGRVFRLFLARSAAVLLAAAFLVPALMQLYTKLQFIELLAKRL